MNTKEEMEVILSEIEDRPIIPMKGSLRGIVVIDNILQLWYSSPTGDSSDVCIHELTCINNTHANTIGEMHLRVWKLI